MDKGVVQPNLADLEGVGIRVDVIILRMGGLAQPNLDYLEGFNYSGLHYYIGGYRLPNSVF